MREPLYRTELRRRDWWVGSDLNAHARRRLPGYSRVHYRSVTNPRWCGRRDSNSHALSSVRPSTWCVYRFTTTALVRSARLELARPYEHLGLSQARLHYARSACLVRSPRVELGRPKATGFEPAAATSYATIACSRRTRTRTETRSVLSGTGIPIPVMRPMMGWNGSGSWTRTSYHSINSRGRDQSRRPRIWWRSGESNPRPLLARQTL